MARIVIIGGSGHVGTYLVPRLIDGGHSVVNVSRGERLPYTANALWNLVETVAADRTTEDAAGTFGARIAALEPDIVVDMISFTLASTQHLVEALRGRVQHFLHCGTIWVYGHNRAVPASEDDPLNPVGEYGTGKAEIETWLLREARTTSFPATVFRPGHIVGQAGSRSIPPVISISMCSLACAAANRWSCRISGWKRCIMFTPTTWHRSYSARLPTAVRPWARLSTRCRHRL
jgi:nucleoside-diphosphate-sugar epimerase